MSQGILPYQYQEDPQSLGMTALGGLPTYLDLAAVSRITEWLHGLPLQLASAGLSHTSKLELLIFLLRRLKSVNR